MIYEHPLAYVLGLEGIALLRAFTGEYDRTFVEQRLAEIRRLLDDDSLTNAVDVARVDTVDGYRIWTRRAAPAGTRRRSRTCRRWSRCWPSSRGCCAQAATW